jgi:hypothetical protein
MDPRIFEIGSVGAKSKRACRQTVPSTFWLTDRAHSKRGGLVDKNDGFVYRRRVFTGIWLEMTGGR